jgi:hypothetical protein
MLDSLRFSVMLSSLLLLAAPSLAQSPPEPTRSAYFTTYGGGMIFRTETKPVTPGYSLILDLSQNIPAGAVAVAEFENPANSSKPLSTTYVFKANEKRIGLLSPNLSCVTNGRNYRILVTLYSDAKRTRILGTHEQAINFTVTPAQVEQFGIPLCQK